MVANLVSRCNREEAREMLMLSFAQYQRDHDVVRLQARLARRRTEYNDRREQSRSPFGDIEEYRSLQQKMKDGAATSSVDLSNLRPGDVVYSAVGAYRGPVVIAATAHRSNGLRLSVVTASGKLATVTSQEFVGDGTVVGTVVMPGSFTPHKKEFRQEAARRLKRAKLRPEGARHSRANEPRNRENSEVHPVELDPDLKTRLRAAEDADRRAKELERLEREIASRQGSLGRDYDGVVSVMSKLGFLKEHEWLLTKDGKPCHVFFMNRTSSSSKRSDRAFSTGCRPPSLQGLSRQLCMNIEESMSPHLRGFRRESSKSGSGVSRASVSRSTPLRVNLVWLYIVRQTQASLPLPTGGVQELSSLTLLTMVILREVTSFETSGK